MSPKGDTDPQLRLPSEKGKFVGTENPEQECFPGQGQCSGLSAHACRAPLVLALATWYHPRGACVILCLGEKSSSPVPLHPQPSAFRRHPVGAH